MIFYGTEKDLKQWKTHLSESIGREGGDINEDDEYGHSFHISVTEEERTVLFDRWIRADDDSTDKSGRPIPWNERLHFKPGGYS